MLREKLEHLVEEADTGRDLVNAAPLDSESARNPRLFRVAFDRRGSHAFHHRFKRIDVVQNGDSFLRPEKRDQLMMSRAGGRRDANERNAGFSRARASSTVSPIYQRRAALEPLQILSRPSGSGLGRVTSSLADDG